MCSYISEVSDRKRTLCVKVKDKMGQSSSCRSPWSGTACLSVFIFLIQLLDYCYGQFLPTYISYDILSDRICNRFHKREVTATLNRPIILEMRPESSHSLSTGTTLPKQCNFEVESWGGFRHGLVSVVQKMSFRYYGDACVDYIQIVKRDIDEDHRGARICGDALFGLLLDDNETLPLPFANPLPPTPPRADSFYSSVLVDMHRINPYESIVSEASEVDLKGELKTHLFISNRTLRINEEPTQLKIVYTMYQDDILSDRICNRFHKREVTATLNRPIILEMRPESSHSLSTGTTLPKQCNFEVESWGGFRHGLVSVVQKMSFRYYGDACVDYIQIVKRDIDEDQRGARICGDALFGLLLDDNETLPLPFANPLPPTPPRADSFYSSVLVDMHRINPYESIVSEASEVDLKGELKTHLFISNRTLRINEEPAQLKIVYTAYQECDGRRVPDTLFHCGYGLCIHYSLVNDCFVNCPFGDCIDETNCTNAKTANITAHIVRYSPSRSSSGAETHEPSPVAAYLKSKSGGFGFGFRSSRSPGYYGSSGISWIVWTFVILVIAVLLGVCCYQCFCSSQERLTVTVEDGDKGAGGLITFLVISGGIAFCVYYCYRRRRAKKSQTPVVVDEDKGAEFVDPSKILESNTYYPTQPTPNATPGNGPPPGGQPGYYPMVPQQQPPPPGYTQQPGQQPPGYPGMPVPQGGYPGQPQNPGGQYPGQAPSGYPPTEQQPPSYPGYPQPTSSEQPPQTGNIGFNLPSLPPGGYPPVPTPGAPSEAPTALPP